ncbi:hypothetical protein ACVWZW_002761 [Bradyrhizobium sp. F1.13.4]
MKIASFTIAGTASFGIVTDNGVIDAGKRLKAYPTLKTLLAKGSLDELKKLAGEKPDHALQDVTLLPTVPDPDKIFCIGVNYATHLAESGHPTPPHPMIFTRFANSQVGHGQPMIRPLESERFDYEGEMAVVIGKAGRRISREAALSHVAGYACYNDGSIRDWQRHTSQFAPRQEFRRHGRLWALDGHDRRIDRRQQADADHAAQRGRGAEGPDLRSRLRRAGPDCLLLHLHRARARRRHRHRHDRRCRRLS